MSDGNGFLDTVGRYVAIVCWYLGHVTVPGLCLVGLFHPSWLVPRLSAFTLGVMTLGLAILWVRVEDEMTVSEAIRSVVRDV